MPVSRRGQKSPPMTMIEAQVLNDENEVFAFKRKRSVPTVASEPKKKRKTSNAKKSSQDPQKKDDKKDTVMPAKNGSSQREQNKKTRQYRPDALDNKILSSLAGDAAILYEILCEGLAIQLKEARKQYCGSQRVYFSMLEIACQMIKRKLVEFLQSNDPQSMRDTESNPINVTNQQKLKELMEKEERLLEEQSAWDKVLEEAQSASLACGSPSNDDSIVQLSPALTLGQECSKKIEQIFSSLADFPAQVALLDSSTKSMDRLLLAANVARDDALRSFQAHEFQSYPSVSQPKSLVQALLSTSNNT